MWTDESRELAKNLWTTENLTAGQIAARIGGGITRNAVIGIMNRAGLQKEKRAPKPKQREPRGPFIRPAPKAAPIVASEPAAVSEAPGPHAVPMLDLTADQCRWAYGDDPKTMLFCAAEVVKGALDYYTLLVPAQPQRK